MKLILVCSKKMFNWEKRIHNNISIEIQSYKSKREGNSGERKNKNETVHHWADRHQFGPLSLFLHACARPRNLPVTDTRARVGSGRARAHHFHWCVDPRRQVHLPPQVLLAAATNRDEFGVARSCATVRTPSLPL